MKRVIFRIIFRYRIWKWCKECDKLKKKYLKEVRRENQNLYGKEQ
jgi:hypothetical protein